MAAEVLVERPKGVALEPVRLMASDHGFRFPDLEGPLRHLLGK